MNALIAVLVVSVVFGAFVVAAWDLKRRGHKMVATLLVLFAALVVLCLVDLIFITALGTSNTTTFKAVTPSRIAPDKAAEGPPDDK